MPCSLNLVFMMLLLMSMVMAGDGVFHVFSLRGRGGGRGNDVRFVQIVTCGPLHGQGRVEFMAEHGSTACFFVQTSFECQESLAEKTYYNLSTLDFSERANLMRPLRPHPFPEHGWTVTTSTPTHAFPKHLCLKSGCWLLLLFCCC